MNSRLHYVNFAFAGIVGAGAVFIACGASFWTSSVNGHTLASSEPARITVDYPVNGSVFPPEITPPTFLWRDPAESANRWIIEISFADPSAAMRFETPGEFLQPGKIDPVAGPGIDLTSEQASTRIWKPDPATWGEDQTTQRKVAGESRDPRICGQRADEPRIFRPCDHLHLRGSGRGSHLLPRRSPAGSRNRGKGCDPALAAVRSSSHQVGGAEHRRDAKSHSDAKPANLRQLPLVFHGRQDHGAGP